MGTSSGAFPLVLLFVLIKTSLFLLKPLVHLSVSGDWSSPTFGHILESALQPSPRPTPPCVDAGLEPDPK